MRLLNQIMFNKDKGKIHKMTASLWAAGPGASAEELGLWPG